MCVRARVHAHVHVGETEWILGLDFLPLSHPTNCVACARDILERRVISEKSDGQLPDPGTFCLP